MAVKTTERSLIKFGSMTYEVVKCPWCGWECIRALVANHIDRCVENPNTSSRKLDG